MTISPTPAGYADLTTRDGIQTGVTTDSSHLNIRPAAAVLAQAVTTAIVISALSDDMFWLCAVEEGAVWPVGDLTGSRDRIAARLAEILQDVPDAAVHDHTGMFHSQASARTFADLVTDSYETGTTVQPLSASTSPRRKIGIVAAAAAILIVGYFGRTYLWQPESPSVVRPDPAEQAAAALDREREAVREALSRNAGVVLAQFVDLIYDRPLRAAGWQLVSYEWTVDGELTARWQRRHGNIETMDEYLSGSLWTFDEPTGEIVETIPFETPPIDAATPLSDLLDTGPGRYEFLDQLSAFEGLWSLAAANPAGLHVDVTRSLLTGSSKRLANALEVALVFHGAPIRITKLEATLTRGSGWKLAGEFYENS